MWAQHLPEATLHSAERDQFNNVTIDHVTGESYAADAARIVNALKAKTGHAVSVYLSDYPMNISLPGKGIFMSRKGLRDLRSHSTDTFFSSALCFLLMHEYAHQMQFQNYKTDMATLTSCEKRALYEVQADILSGYFFGLYKGLNNEDRLRDTMANDFMDVLTYIYKLGITEFALGTHPSHKERRNAFRLGVAYSLVEGNVEKTRKERAKKTIDYRPEDSYMDWSLKMAKRVAHFPASVLQEIALQATEDIKWDTSRNHPFMSYRQVFKNIGDKPIKVYIQYNLTGRERDNPDPERNMLYGDIHNYNFLVNPGDTFPCVGSLNWAGLALRRYMPVFIDPPDNNSLYNAEYADGTEPQLDGQCPSSVDYGSNQQEKLDLSLALAQANIAALNDFRFIRTGFALPNEEGDRTYYNVNLVFPGAIEAQVLRDEGEKTYSLDVDYVDDKDSLTAHSVFRELLRSLQLLEKNGTLSIKTKKQYDEELPDDYTVPDEWGSYYRITDSVIVTRYEPRDISRYATAVFPVTRNRLTLHCNRLFKGWTVYITLSKPE